MATASPRRCETVKQIGGFAALLVLVVACRGRDVHAVLIYDARTGAAKIESLEAIVDDDVASAPTLRPGERFDMYFRADGSAPHLVLNYTLGSKRYAWAGPPIPITKRYDIDVRLDDGGNASCRHCIRPCEVSAAKWSDWAAVAHW
jgi:hypothetical protein